MGVILRQGSKHSMLNYVAMIIGFVNVIILYPLVLDKQQIGLIDFLLQTANLMSPFVLIGVHGVAIKYFPFFKDNDEKNKDNGFLGLLLGIAAVGFCLFLLIFLLFKPSILSFYVAKDEIWNEYIYYIIPFVFTASFGILLTKYISNLFRIAFPYLVGGFMLKVTRSVLSLLLFFSIISFSGLLNGLVIVSLFSVVALSIYIYKMGHWNLRTNFKKIDRPLGKEMISYGLYGMLGSLGPIVGNYIDTVMLVSFINLESAGLYTIPMYIAIGIAIPATSVLGISAPIVSQFCKNNDYESLAKLYKQTSINLVTIGLLLLLLAWSCSNDLFDFMPNGDSFRSGRIIILILGISKIFDMATSINNQILGYSKYYKYNLYLILILVATNIIGNMLLIPEYGIIGVAYASLLALFIFNTLKVIVIYHFFKILPFSINHIKVFLIIAGIYGLTLLLPLNMHPLINIGIRAAIIFVLFLPAIYYLKISSDINQLINKVLKIKN
jgi:O-antigen/teichoic acid export membrane protein